MDLIVHMTMYLLFEIKRGEAEAGVKPKRVVFMTVGTMCFDALVKVVDSLDLERLPLEEVFEQLRTSRGGLTSEDAEARLHNFGPNLLEEKPLACYHVSQHHEGSMEVSSEYVAIAATSFDKIAAAGVVEMGPAVGGKMWVIVAGTQWLLM
ncbi:hypothetical protein PTKIN_Ptkin03bG0195700 [Pterospermum kingtungense]